LITVPDTNATLNAADLTSVSTNNSSINSGYSIASANARFVLKTNGTANGLALTSTNNAPVDGYVWTAFGTTGAGYWAAASGGLGGLTAHDPAVFATNNSKIYVKPGAKFTNTLFYGAISLPINQGLDTPFFTNSSTIYSSDGSHANSFIQNAGVFTIQNAGTAENWISYTEASGDLGLRGVSITGTSNVFGAGTITTATLRAKSGIFGNLNPTNATSGRLAGIGADGIVTNLTPTTAEANFLSGVTAAIQTQFVNDTNNVNARGTESTNFARGTIGLAATNAIQAAGTESTNFARGTIGLAATNAIQAAGTESTNFARASIGLGATNLANQKIASNSGLGTNLQVEAQLRFREGGNETFRMYSSATNWFLEDEITPLTVLDYEYLKQYLAVGVPMSVNGITNAGRYVGTGASGGSVTLSDTGSPAKNYEIRVPSTMHASLTNTMGPFLFASATNAMIDLNLGNQFIQTNHSTTNIILLLTNPAPYRMYSVRVPGATNSGSAYTVRFDAPTGYTLSWNTNNTSTLNGSTLTNTAGGAIEAHFWIAPQGTSNVVQSVYGRNAF
jgi:hypothetical protein